MKFKYINFFLTISRSPGIIQDARINSFEAGSKNGILTVNSYNTGYVIADYTV